LKQEKLAMLEIIFPNLSVAHLCAHLPKFAPNVEPQNLVLVEQKISVEEEEPESYVSQEN
jgi:hypothetical protein